MTYLTNYTSFTIAFLIIRDIATSSADLKEVDKTMTETKL